MNLGFFRRSYGTKAALVDEAAGAYLGRVHEALDAAGLDDMPGAKRLGVTARILARVSHRWPDEHRMLMMGLASLPTEPRLMLLLAGPALWQAEEDERAVDAMADAAVATVVAAKAPATAPA